MSVHFSNLYGIFKNSFYPISIPVGFSLGKSVSMGIGIVGSLLSALLVTGLGDFIWKFLPWGWGVRFMDYCVLRYVNEGQFHSNLPEFQGLYFFIVSFIYASKLVKSFLAR